MSIMGFVRAAIAAFSVLEPQVSKFIDTKKELAELKIEKERLEAENKALRTQSLVTLITSIVFFVAFVVVLVILLSSRCRVM